MKYCNRCKSNTHHKIDIEKGYLVCSECKYRFVGKVGRPNKENKRNKSVRVRVASDFLERLEWICSVKDISKSDYIRDLVRKDINQFHQDRQEAWNQS